MVTALRHSKVRPSARLEARLSLEVHAQLKRAAELAGRTLTDFVVTAAQEAAQRTIDQNEVMRLSLADQQLFFKAILNPPSPSPALTRAAERSRRLFRAS